MKKILRRIRIAFLSILLVVLSVSLLLYINYDDPQNQISSVIPSKLHSCYPDKYTVRPIGRSFYEGGVRYLSYSGSGAEFVCKGEYVTIKLIDDSQGRYLSNHKARYAIYKNGVIIEDDILTESERICTVSLDGYGSESVIKILKLSEAQYSSMGIGEICVYGKKRIEPTAEKDLKIEFIGDSITCGYGIDEANDNGYFTTATENFTKTYAYLTAENLSADCSAVCFSGFGVYSGYTTGGIINSADVLPLHYDKACYLYGGREILWDFRESDNDIVVINLGTNDASYCAKSVSGRQEFTRRYTDFIRQVRFCNPDAYILCILGDMNNSLYPCIEQSVSDYTAATSDYRVSATTIEYKMGENDIVINGHPGYMSNLYAANELTAKIRELRYVSGAF